MKHVLPLCAAIALLPGLAVPAAADQPVAIRFAAEIAGQPFACNATYQGLGAPAADVTATDFRLFVATPALVRADGSMQPIALQQDGIWQLEDLALLDFEDGSAGCSGSGNAGTNTTLRGTVPDGEYVGLAFTIGVPFGQNHVDPTLAAAPLNTTGMFWTWQNGFRFIRIDLVPVATGMDDMGHAASQEAGQDGAGHGGAKGWFLHLGSTQCAAGSKTEAPSACASPNRMQILLPDFDPANQIVVIDPAPVLAEVDLRVNAPETSPGCMSAPGDSDCNTVMPKLGLAFDNLAAGPQLLITAR